LPELIVGESSDRVYDAIRDTAVDLGVPLRSLRSRAHSLEEVYLDAVERGAMELEAAKAIDDGQ
jgi:hypothetical protein